MSLDRRGRASAAELADQQQVAVGVVAGEREATAPGGVAEADLVLEEPEAQLGVATVVEAVDPEEDDLAGRARARTGPRVWRQPVAGGEAVRDRVLVRDPCPWASRPSRCPGSGDPSSRHR